MRRIALYLVATTALAALLYYPLSTARPYADDFAFFTMARQIEEPWRLLVQDAYGLFFFRPVGAFFWWLTTALFGDHFAAHYLTNVVLHLGCASLLLVFARSLSISAPVAAASAIAFAAHPTAFSAAAWLSDRFDLLAVLFGLASLVCVQRFIARGSKAWAAGAALAAFASMLSKETGFVFPVMGALLLAWADPRHATASARARSVGAIGLVATAVAALGLRTLALRAGADAILFAGGLLHTLVDGTIKWARFLPDFVIAEAGSATAVFAWFTTLMILLLAALLAAARGAFDRSLARAMAMGLTLMLLSAIVQSPVIQASRVLPYNLAGRPADSALFDWLVGNRFYYLSLAGFFVALGAIAEGTWRSLAARGMRGAAVAVSILAGIAILALLAGARAVGRDWSRFTRTQDAALLAATAETFAGSQEWAAGCKLFLLGTHEYSRTFLYVADVFVKHTLPRGHALMGCLVQTEVAPWFHLADHRKLQRVSPLEMITIRGKPYPPLQVGNMAVYYLRIPDSEAVRNDPDSRFFAYDGKRFVEVTGAVREGRRSVRFFDNRPPG
jgi:Dolichyl-phosphate-mannose-protein mannosyltransferase